MATRVVKSKNFDSNLDATRMKKEIDKRLWSLSSVVRTNANRIAPLDSGNLRNSAYVVRTSNGFVVVWAVDYAIKVFLKNNKNPQTTRWTEKDNRINGKIYLNYMTKGVIK